MLRLLLSVTTKSPPPPAIARNTTANVESVRIHRRHCYSRHNRLELPLLQILGLAVSAGGTDDFIHLLVCNAVLKQSRQLLHVLNFRAKTTRDPTNDLAVRH